MIVSAPAPPTRMVLDVAIGVPTSVPPLPLPISPRLWPAVEPLRAAIVSVPAPGPESVTTIAVPPALSAAVSRELALEIDSKICLSVNASLRST